MRGVNLSVPVLVLIEPQWFKRLAYGARDLARIPQRFEIGFVFQ
jgi:hypothetical protein